MAARLASGRRIGSVLLLATVLGACGNAPAASAPAAAVATPSTVPSRSPSAAPSVAPSAAPSVAPTPSAAAPSVDPGPSIDPAIADLTGVTTDPSRAHRLPMAVLLDDSTDRAPSIGLQRRIARLPRAGRRRRDTLHVRLPGGRQPEDRPGPQRPHLLHPLGQRNEGCHRPLWRRPTEPLVSPGLPRAADHEHGCPRRFRKGVPSDLDPDGAAQRLYVDSRAQGDVTEAWRARSRRPTTCTATRSWRPALQSRAPRRNGSGSRTGRV